MSSNNPSVRINRHRLGHDQLDPVSPGRRYGCEGDTGVPGGGLDEDGVLGSYIAEVIDSGRRMTVIDFDSPESLITNISEHLREGIDYVANALDSGFLTTTIILAMVTAVLTVVAHTLGRDDVEALQESEREEEE